MADRPVSARSVIATIQAPTRVAHLGKYQRGQKVLLLTPSLSAMPAACPMATITGPNFSETREVGLLDRFSRVFLLQLFLGQSFDLGTYTVDFRAVVGGSPWTYRVTFDVIAGGDSGGNVISLHVAPRPEATYVLAQLSSGRLVQGKNPSV